MTHSVLIAAYNAAAFLPQALASLRAQTDADWELVVVEDGSRDATENIVRGFAATVAQPVRYENTITNRGVAVTRTRLLELARGESCSFLDADDWWEARHLENARARHAAGADFAVSDISIHEAGARRPPRRYAPQDAFVASPAAALFRGSVIMTSSCVSLRRGLALRIGAFDPSLRIGEDRDYWLRCALAGARFALTREATCAYAKHAASTMTRTQLWAACETAFYEKYQSLETIPRAERRRLLAHALQNEARLLRKNDPAGSACLLRRAIALTPASPALVAQWMYSKLRSASALR